MTSRFAIGCVVLFATLLGSCKFNRSVQTQMRQQTNTPIAIEGQIKAAIVISKTTFARWENPKLNMQLWMNIQTQCIMAGIPFDILTLEELNEQSLQPYAAVILPYAAYVPEAKRESIANLIESAVAQNKVIVTAENFLTANENGKLASRDAYDVMRRVLYLDSNESGQEANLTVRRVRQSQQPVQYGSITYPMGWYRVYVPLSEPSEVVLHQKIKGTDRVAGILVKNRILHVSTPQILADSMIIAEMLPQLLMPSRQVQLRLSREPSVFIARGDMDQAKDNDRFAASTVGAQKALLELQKKYNFVASLYITIGDKRIKKTEFTDWAKAQPIYKKYLEAGFEIGTHTFSHPEHTHDKSEKLTDAQLDYEFVKSAKLIESKLATKVVGAAIPGNPDPLDAYLGTYLDSTFGHLTGDYSGSPESGFFNAFGYLAPSAKLLYLSPNFYSDFTILNFKKQSPETALTTWKNQFTRVSNNTPLPIYHWPWHDYAISGADKLYPKKIFSDFVDFVARSAHAPEFVTASDFVERFGTLRNTKFSVANSGQTITVASADNLKSGLGALTVRVSEDIKAVKNWYAYGSRDIYLPQAGGIFEVEYGTPSLTVTHITKIPSRARLISLKGNGSALSFEIDGQGKVSVATGGDMKVNCGQGITSQRTPSGYDIVLPDRKVHSCHFESLLAK